MRFQDLENTYIRTIKMKSNVRKRYTNLAELKIYVLE